MIKYNIDNENNVLVTQVGERVTIQDVLQHITAISRDVFANSLRKELIVVMGSGTGLSFSEMFTVVEADQKRCGDRDRYIAIVVESLIAYGVSRMFTEMQGNKHYHIRIFRNNDKALQWLKSIDLSSQLQSIDKIDA